MMKATVPRPLALALDQVLIDRHDVAKLLHTSPGVVQKLERGGDFPRPIRLRGWDKETPLWRTREVLDWLDGLEAVDGNPSA